VPKNPAVFATKHFLTSLALISAGLISTSVSAQSSKDNLPNTGFIPDYTLLKPVVNPPEGSKIHRYRNPAIQPGAYTSVIIEPIQINEAPDTDNKIPPGAISETKAALADTLKSMAAQRATVVTEPGPGVARIALSISGAELEGEKLRPRNLLPISAILKIAAAATGNSSQQAVLIIEAKITDSVSGDLIAAGVNTIKGESFRGDAKTTQEFLTVVKRWAEIAATATTSPSPTPR
jgi:hypothetical protein